jgi:hypothetical protein
MTLAEKRASYSQSKRLLPKIPVPVQQLKNGNGNQNFGSPTIKSTSDDNR